jgi:hypothetical protein
MPSSHEMTTVSTIRIPAMVSDRQVRIVSPNPRTPVIFNSAGGGEPGVACSCAAENESPGAHTAPRPVYAAAPIAR